MTTPVRPSLLHARRIRTLYRSVATVTVAIVAIFAATGGINLERPERAKAVDTSPAPWDYTVAAWDAALGGDQELTAQAYSDLGAYDDEKLTEAQTADLKTLARAVVTADLTDPVPDRWPGYWPTASSTGAVPSQRCESVDITGISPASLPVSAPSPLYDDFAKVLVTYTGTCADGTYTTTAPGVTYVYAGQVKKQWQPLRSWQVPSNASADDVIGATEPYEWELAEIDRACTAGVIARSRIAVADAFAQMCTAAAQAGVELRVVSAFRTRAEQASLFADAVTYYGSADEAREHVAYADADVCESKHCSGLAVNVRDDAKALGWLTATIGCVAGDGAVTEATACDTGTPVPQAARWGFAAPLKSVPGYLEFTLPIGTGANSSLGAPDCSPSGTPIANMVAAIFRCRLAREGVIGTAQDEVVAQALVVSRCESGWNASAAAFGGRYATQPNPVDDQLYTNKGVFMLTAELAEDGWVAGGVKGLTDPVANINAAASLWLATRGWEQFGCATGADGGFEAGPVLPTYGGPPLPDWSHTF